MTQQTKSYYEEIGWKPEGDTLVDLARWEDLRESSAAYNELCERRIYRHIPQTGRRFLDVGCGPLLHAGLLRRTSSYAEYHCVDFSPDALAVAAQKLGPRGYCHRGDFMDLDLPRASFDCVVALSCLFHVEADRQEKFVLRMLELAAPGAPVVVSYVNPDDFTHRIGLHEMLERQLPVYPSYAHYHVHPMSWWTKLASVAVELHPVRTLRTVDQRAIIPSGPAGVAVLTTLARLEAENPALFLSHGHYYVAILRR